HSFTVDQLRSFSRFDRLLRLDEFDAETTTVPGGYTLFQSLWNMDADCPYQFSSYDTVTGLVTTFGPAIPIDELAPLIREQPAPANSLTPEQLDLVSGMLWAAAKR
ncbi:hypothetical protein B0H21DRAFT_672884, partial [Amylocystis lapponica]